MTEDTRSITELLTAAGYRHARDDYSHIDHRHSIWRGETFVGRFDAGEAVKLSHEQRSKQMVGYLHRARGGTWELTIVQAPCNGIEFQAGEKVQVAGKREANAICKARGVKPLNF